MRNLDQIAAKAAQEMVKKTRAPELETLVTKTLGVLQENGVYACVLFLDSRSSREKEMAEQIRKQLEQVLDALYQPEQNAQSAQDRGGCGGPEAKPYRAEQNKNLREWIADHLASQLDQLLLVKQLWEQTLIYARYSAKAAASAKSSE
ncbi:MAG: hypothetical protein ACK4VW_10145 [Anaerolineales bacterium]